MANKLQFELDVKNADALRKALDLSDSMRDGFKPMIDSVSEIQKKVKELSLIMNDKDNPFNKKDGGSLIKRYAGEKFKEEANDLVENIKKIKAVEKELFEQRESFKEKFNASGSQEDLKAAAGAEASYSQVRAQRVNAEMQSWAQGKGADFYKDFTQGTLGLGGKFQSLDKFNELSGKGTLGRVSDIARMNFTTGEVMGTTALLKGVGSAVMMTSAGINAAGALSDSFGSMEDRGFAAMRNIGLQAGQQAISGNFTTLALEQIGKGQLHKYQTGRPLEHLANANELFLGNARKIGGTVLDGFLGTNLGAGGAKNQMQIEAEAMAKKIAQDKAIYEPLFDSVGKQALRFGSMFGSQERSWGKIRNDENLRELALYKVDAEAAAPLARMLSGYGQQLRGSLGAGAVQAGTFGMSMSLMEQSARYGTDATGNISKQEARIFRGLGAQNVDVRESISEVMAERMFRGSGENYLATAGSDFLASMSILGYNKENKQQGSREDVRTANRLSEIMTSTNDFQQAQQFAYLASKGIVGSAAIDVLAKGITSPLAKAGILAATGGKLTETQLNSELDSLKRSYAGRATTGALATPENAAYWETQKEKAGFKGDTKDFVAGNFMAGPGNDLNVQAATAKALSEGYSKTRSKVEGQDIDTTDRGRYKATGLPDKDLQTIQTEGRAVLQLKVTEISKSLMRVGADASTLIYNGFEKIANELDKTHTQLTDDNVNTPSTVHPNGIQAGDGYNF